MNSQNEGRQLSFRFAHNFPVVKPSARQILRPSPAPMAQKRITSTSPGQDADGPINQLSIKLIPPRSTKILRKPMPEPILSQDNHFSIRRLKETMASKYPKHTIGFVEVAYRFAEEIYRGKRREDGDVAIVHPLAGAQRAAEMGMKVSAICGFLLHDAIEDTNKKKANERSVCPDQILRLFGPEPAAMECGRRTAELVVLLTKPKFIEKEKRWVFANTEEYFQVNDEYYAQTSLLLKSANGKRGDPSLYDDRSEAYYSFLMSSGDIDAIVLKLLDNIHNAETMHGLHKDKVMKNLRTMARNTMRYAAIFLVQKDVEYITGLFRGMGIDIERSVKPIVPITQVIPFELRARFDAEALLKHPDPQYAYITIYGSNPLVALAMNYVEVGFPPRLGINYAPMLNDYLGHEFHVVPEESAVPITSPVHESMVKIVGFTDNDARAKIIQPSQAFPRSFDLLDERGKIITSVALASLAKREVRLGPHADELIAEADERYDLLKELLRTFYQDKIYPVLEKHPVNQ
ncbi:MAG: hypothetical protein GY852_03945 [bacterium]|nr:hypothetical protein [bacterium]